MPLISMIDTARDYAKKCGYRKVCLMGTLPTMNGTFFQNTFEKSGIEVVVPNDSDKNYIGSKIETELEYGKIISSTQEHFAEIANDIADKENVQAIVLGCTELPLIFRDIAMPVPYIDVMQVHIDALIDIAAGI